MTSTKQLGLQQLATDLETAVTLALASTDRGGTGLENQ
jgi:hypothetical protein